MHNGSQHLRPANPNVPKIPAEIYSESSKLMRTKEQRVHRQSTVVSTKPVRVVEI